MLSHDGVEVRRDVQLQNILDRLAENDPVDLIQRLVWVASRPRPVGAGQKIRLEDLIEQSHRRLLHDLVFQGRDRDRSLLSVFLRNVDPAQRLGTVGFAFQLLPKCWDVLVRLFLVVLIRDLVHPGTGVLS